MPQTSTLTPLGVEAGPRVPKPSKGYAVDRDGKTLFLSGRLRMQNADVIWRALTEATEGLEGGELTIDLRKVELVDGGVMSLLVDLRARLDAARVNSRFLVSNERVAAMIDLYAADQKPVRAEPVITPNPIERLGAGTASLLEELKGAVTFIGSLAADVGAVIRKPKSANWRDVLPLIERAGFDAIPIVLLINFLVGFVMGFQSAHDLRNYGADIFVADIVSLSVTRELAPLMCAIVVTGRSGAGFTAELGTMRVSDEIDALRVMGLGPVRYLVLPRMLALVVVVPLLTLASDVVGVGGGMLAANRMLDITPTMFFAEMRQALVPWDVIAGLIKSVFFALAIATIACQQGFATTGGASGVGRRTTTTVVSTLFILVILDTLLTSILMGIHI